MDFKEAQLSKALARNSKFMGADFTNAILDRISFDGADLTGAILKNTVLSGTTFTNAILTDVDFSDSYLGECLTVYDVDIFHRVSKMTVTLKLGPFDLKNLCSNPSLSGKNPVSFAWL